MFTETRRAMSDLGNQGLAYGQAQWSALSPRGRYGAIAGATAFGAFGLYATPGLVGAAAGAYLGRRWGRSFTRGAYSAYRQSGGARFWRASKIVNTGGRIGGAIGALTGYGIMG